MNKKLKELSADVEQNQRQEQVYQSLMEDFAEWMLRCGKDVEKNEPLAQSTAENYCSRVQSLYKRVWKAQGYTTRIEVEQAQAYFEMLYRDEIRDKNDEVYKGSTKRRHKDAVEKYFEFLALERGGETWKCEFNFEENSTRTRDYLLKNERKKLRDSVLEYGSIPAYGGLSPDERDRWKAHIAQKLGKPKHEVSPDDWERLNVSWKWVSLIWVTLDAGLRPCEVERAKLSWFRPSKGEIHIPRKEASKNREDWEVALRADTVDTLTQWLAERSNIGKYDSSDALWLNRQGNPYCSKTLNYHFHRLLELGEIGDENRNLTWYSIRHSTGTYMNEEVGLAATGAQLRHKNLGTTRQYVHPPTDTRRKALNAI